MRLTKEKLAFLNGSCYVLVCGFPIFCSMWRAHAGNMLRIKMKVPTYRVLMQSVFYGRVQCLHGENRLALATSLAMKRDDKMKNSTTRHTHTRQNDFVMWNRDFHFFSPVVTTRRYYTYFSVLQVDWYIFVICYSASREVQIKICDGTKLVDPLRHDSVVFLIVGRSRKVMILLRGCKTIICGSLANLILTMMARQQIYNNI